MLCCIISFIFLFLFVIPPAVMSGSCKRKGEKSRKDKKREKRVESKQKSALFRGELYNCSLYSSSSSFPSMRQESSYVRWGCLKTKKPQTNKQKRKPLRWSSRYPRICLSLSPSLTRMPRTKFGWSIEVHFSLSPRSQLIAWLAFPWGLGGPKSN